MICDVMYVRQLRRLYANPYNVSYGHIYTLFSSSACSQHFNLIFHMQPFIDTYVTFVLFKELIEAKTSPLVPNILRNFQPN